MRFTTGLHPISYLFALVLVACGSIEGRDHLNAEPDGQLVRNIEEFNQAVANLELGDRIVMASGTWNNVELQLHGIGSEEFPILLTAEKAGDVIISGQSNLRFSGEHIIVSDLVFKDGSTPTGEVISFSTTNEALANNSRVTNTVIDNFSTTERPMSDLWVSIYGKNNRFDNNSLVNKRNRGVTVAVRLNSEASRKNNHVIEYNYFGPRQILGANGGEALRIGTSHFSREYSNTIVRNNFFDRTNGEHEIISNKSGGNILINNVFFETQGTLTMRHGHFTTVEGNYFLGNRKPNTGGIRIINESQSVSNNYMYGLTGHRLRGALVIMNGVPNSPPNRYDPVIDSAMNNNIVIDSDYIELGAGADEERSAPPTTSEFKGNIILGNHNLTPFTLYDDMSGINFERNYINDAASVPRPIESGFVSTPYTVAVNEHGLKAPDRALLEEIGFGEVKLPVTREDVGASYYPKDDAAIAFQSGTRIRVDEGTDTLVDALNASNPGDVLVLENGGEYLLTRFAEVHHPITIMAEEGAKPLIRAQKPNFIIIENGGALEIENLWFDGAESPDYKGNSVISTSTNSMNINYSLVVRNIKVTDLDINGYFYFFKANEGTFADSIEIIDSEFSNITGAILLLNREVDDLGVYSVENLTISGNTFTDIKEEVATVYRGGFDESTFGPMVTVTDNSLVNVGNGKTHRSTASMYFHGVQRLHISDTSWEASAPPKLYLTNGEPITVIKNIQLIDSGEIQSNHNGYIAESISYERDRVPASKFDLSHWSITMPLDEDGDGSADVLGTPELQSYSHPEFFYLDKDDRMVFTSPNKATTSPTSTNTRSELRYMSRGSDTSIKTASPANNFALASHEEADKFAAIGGKLEVTMQVDHVSLNAGNPHKPPAYSVVIGQIHGLKRKEKTGGFGYGNEPLKISYKKWPGHKTGSVYWTYERNLPVEDPNRIDIAYPVWGNNWDDPSDPGERGIALGEVFSYTVNVHEDTIYLTFESENHDTVRHQINLADNVDANGIVDPYDHTEGYAQESLYFKAGTYNQCSTKVDKSWRYPACPGTGDWHRDKANGNYASSRFHRLHVSNSTPPD